MNHIQPASESTDLLNNLSDTHSADPSMGAVLRAIFRQFQGPEGFAREVKADFDACNIGHANRIRIEADVIRALSNYEGDVEDKAVDQETLKAMARQLLAEQHE